jgi:hypothetical protein
MARVKKLDYNYGQEEEGQQQQPESENLDVDNIIKDSDELLLESRKKKTQAEIAKEEEIHARARARQQRAEAKKKYLSYSDFVKNTDYDSNGYKYDAKDDFSKLDINGWSRMVGFLLVRIASPLLLVVHGVILGLVLWKVYGFDFGQNSVLSKQNAMPWCMGALCLHALLVHGVAKLLFSKTYYKRRGRK